MGRPAAPDTADFSSVAYAPPVAGGIAHLLFLRDDTLMAQRFDDETREPVDDPFPVASPATFSATRPQIAATVANGTLVYLAAGSGESQLTWFDRAGKPLGTAGSRIVQRGIVLSPDGNTVLTRRQESSGQSALWSHDLARGSDSRFLPPGQSSMPVWFPDGRRVLFGASGTFAPGWYQKDANSSGPGELLSPMAGDAVLNPSGFSPDGRFLVYTVEEPGTQADIWAVPWNAGADLRQAVKLVATEAVESQGQVSPDGGWIAYTSNETGAYEIYVRPFPDGPGVWKVSANGGREPRWSADGKQLYYLERPNTERGTLMSAAVESAGRGVLRTAPPQRLFDIRASTIVPQGNTFLYSPHPDGQRFLVNASIEEAEPTINVITHWQQVLPGR